MGPGQIIGHMFVKGAPSVLDGEKRVEYTEAHTAAAKAAAEAVENGRIPRELREYVRDYFSATKPAPATTPAPEEKKAP
jgi:hypothetical protein